MTREEFKRLLVGDRVYVGGNVKEEAEVVSVQTDVDWAAWEASGKPRERAHTDYQYTWAVELSNGLYIKASDRPEWLAHIRRIN